MAVHDGDSARLVPCDPYLDKEAEVVR